MQTKMRNKMKNTTLKMIAITGLFLVSLNSVAFDGFVWITMQPYLEEHTEFHKDASHCVSITNENRASWVPSHNIVNNCGFDVMVFYCSPDTSKPKVRCDVKGVHFSRFTEAHEAYSDRVTRTPVRLGSSLEWFACGANGVSNRTDNKFTWAIKPNTPYSDRFSCYARE